MCRHFITAVLAVSLVAPQGDCNDAAQPPLPFTSDGTVMFGTPRVAEDIRSDIAVTGVAADAEGATIYAFCRMGLKGDSDLVVPFHVANDGLHSGDPFLLTGKAPAFVSMRLIQTVGDVLWVGTFDEERRWTLDSLDPATGRVSEIARMPTDVREAQFSEDNRYVLLRRYGGSIDEGTVCAAELWTLEDTTSLGERIWSERAFGCCWSQRQNRAFIYDPGRGLLVRSADDEQPTQIASPRFRVDPDTTAYSVSMQCTSGTGYEPEYVAISRPLTKHVHYVETSSGWQEVVQFAGPTRTRSRISHLRDAAAGHFPYTYSRDVVLIRASDSHMRRVTTNWGDAMVRSAQFVGTNPIRVAAGLSDGRTALVTFD